MRRQWILAALFVLALQTFAPCVNAQAPPIDITGTRILDFRMSADTGFQFVSLSPSGRGPGGTSLSRTANFAFTFEDLTFTPNQQTVAQQNITFDVHWLPGTDPGKGWLLNDEATDIYYSQKGYTKILSIGIQSTPLNTALQATAVVSATMRSVNRPDLAAVVHNISFTAVVFSTPGFQLEIPTSGPGAVSLEAGVNERVRIPVRVTNTDLYVQAFRLDLTVLPSGDFDSSSIAVTGEGPYWLQPAETQEYNLTLLTPKDTFVYGVTMIYSVTATNRNNPAISFTAQNVLTVQGFYFSTSFLVGLSLLLLLIVFFIFVAIFAKRFRDERVLGKPIPPWKIAEERVLLQRLRREDPKGFYKLRYFTMVQEYESALNWFYSFKRRNSRRLRAEAKAGRLSQRAEELEAPTTLAFDRRADRLRKRFSRREERQRLKTEAELEHLQEKLDRHFEEDYEKDHEKWSEKVEKLTKKANKPWHRAHKKWEANVEKLMAKWEKPFAKDKAKHEKAMAKALEKHEKVVKKQDKPAWKDWKAPVATATADNNVREKEGREPLPLPELVSSKAAPPELPPPFKAPPKPKLPPEPKPTTKVDLPPEPQLVKPKLEDSHYARKTRRLKRNSDRKIARIGRKLTRALAKNERDRLRFISQTDRKRGKLLKKAVVATEPSLMARLFRRTPEHRERRNERRMLHALAADRVKSVRDAEDARLEVLMVDLQRREAELKARIIRTSIGGAATDPTANETALDVLRQQNADRLAQERAASQERIRAEQKRAEQDLREQLAAQLVKVRTDSKAAAPAPKPTPAPAKAKAAKRKSH